MPVLDGEASVYQISLQLSDATVAALRQSDFRLYAFRGADAGGPEGQVLVWRAFAELAQEMVITWGAGLAAWTCVAGDDAPSVFYFDTAPGDTVSVTQDDGDGSVARAGAADAISVLNYTTSSLYTGLAEPAGDGGYRRLARFHLYGETSQALRPSGLVLLAFSTEAWQPGQAVPKLAGTAPAGGAPGSSAGLLVRMADGETAHAVGFDINQGWDWGCWAWGQGVGAGDELAPLLINNG
ncbi:hypothetical protein [Pseudoduganella namucuonensis]|uniref:Uncharacterized protein n=1 Tax=Pseudoduganella namucuonensis TaxID=1035707 RepID=A0A1I7F0A1_9BURK|nr:hypothetical protein [Pseudoduganella namucuonensis]SFU29577.1 hypothetical protein SAMN05216552_1001285 [Pseudoduganella namucuonensis]